MARDRSTTLKVVIAGDATQGVRALRDLDRQMKATDDSVKRSARGVQTSLAGVDASAKRVSLRGALGGSASGGFRNIAEAGLQGSVNPLTSFQSAALAQFGGAERVLSGISTKALAVGAGLTVAGFAAAKFGQVSVRNFTATAAAVDGVQDVMGGTAEEASKLVNFAEQFGVSADTLAGSQAKLAVVLGKNGDALRKFGVEAAFADDGTVDMAGTLANIADAYERANGPTARAALLQAAYGKSWTEMVDIVERGAAAIREAREAARGGPIMSDPDLAVAREFKRTATELGQVWKDITTEVGSNLVPALTEALKVAVRISEAIRPLAGPLIEFGTVGEAIPADVRKQIADYHAKARQAKESTTGLGVAMRGTGGAAQFVASAFGYAASTIESLAAKTASALSGFQNATRQVGRTRSTTNDYTAALEALDEVQTSTADSAGSYASAVDNSAEQIADAQESVADAHRAAAEAAEDYAKVQREAAESVAEAEEAAAERIVDAEEKLIEVRERAARQVRDAADKLQDARQAAADAMSQALKDNPFDAQRRREEAIRDLQRAERDYGETVTDSQKDVTDAEKDAADTRTEAAESIADAQKQAAEQIEAAQERVVDAERGAERASRDLERTMRDVAAAQDSAGESASRSAPKFRDVDEKMQGLVDSTFAEVFQMRQLGASSEETQPKIDAAKQKILETAAALGWSEQKTKDYLAQLALIPSQVNTQIVLTMNAQQFLSEMRRVGQSFQDPGTRALFNSGIIEVIGGTQAVPQFAGGGQFRAPAGRNAGLAMLHDREVVLTPDQMAGGGTTVVVQGSLITERALMDIVARAQRRGYKG